MKPKMILKSLAELPASAWSMALSVPARTMQATQEILGPAVRHTRRELRAAHRRSAAVMNDIQNRANAPMRSNPTWATGGINE